MRHHGAFSMIELLMAMALGLLVCATAFAGFQATARVLGRANRLALQNQLLAAGVSYALDDLDGWESWNPPTNPTSGVLYLSNPNLADYTQARPFNRLSMGVDYRPDAPAWWYRFELVRSFSLQQPAQVLDFSLFGKQGDPAPAGSLHELVDDIDRRLGHYGLFDYWPPGVPIGGADATGAPLTWTRGGTGSITVGNTAGNSALLPVYPTTLTSHREAWTLYGLHARPDTVLSGWNRRWYGDNANRPEMFFSRAPNIRLVPATASDPNSAPVSEGPAAWPDVQVQTRRYLCDDGFFTMVSVRLIDSRTGETLAMNFSAPGTSLRGARINRGLDP